MIYVTIPKQKQAQLSTTVTSLYIVPTAPTGMPENKAILSEMLLCNTDSSVGTFSLFIVPSGGTAGVTNAVKLSETLSNSVSIRFQFRTVIEQGGSVQMKASASDKITATLTVAEMLPQMK